MFVVTNPQDPRLQDMPAVLGSKGEQRLRSQKAVSMSEEPPGIIYIVMTGSLYIA